MRKTFSILIVLTACILLCISCNDSKTIQTGMLEIRIDNQDGVKGITPVSMDISGYSVSVMDSDGNVVFSKSITPRDGNGYYKVSLAIGEYTVCAVATNSEGKTIGEGSATVLVEPGKTNSCSIVIHEIEGKGVVCFSYYGEEDDELTVEILNASMIPVATVPLLFNAGVFSESIELDNGFYFYTVSASNGKVLETDTIRVVSDYPVRITDGSGLITITMLYAPSQSEVGSLPDDWAGYQILRDKLGIDLELQMLPSNANDQDVAVRTMAAADELPDFITVSRTVWADLVKQGMFADVTDDFAKMPERSKVMFGDSSKAFTTYDGRIYGFATPSAYAGNEGLLVRKDWLEKLGLKAPTTLDELYDVLYAFTYNDPDGNGKNDTYGYGAFVEDYVAYEAYPGRRFEPLMGAFGVEGTWNMSAANFGLRIHDPAYYDWMVFFKKVIDNGLIDPSWQSYKKDDFRAAWKQGKLGVFREQNSAYASQNNYAPFDANFPDGGFIVVDAPVGPTGKNSVGPLVEGFRIFAINANVSAEKHAKIVEMFEWMSYGEGYMLCSYGMEGKNYILDANGLPQSDESLGDMGYNKAGGQRYIQLRNSSLNYNNAAEIALRYPGYTTKVSQKYMSAGDVLREMQAKTWTRTPGQNSMPGPENPDVYTFYRQGIAEFLNGSRVLNETNWNAFVEQFDSIGGLAWEQAGYEYALESGYLL